MYPRAAVAATVQLAPTTASHPNRYLLVQRANPPDQGLWSIPGGKIELGETTIQAAQRETYEETLLKTCSSLSLHWHWHADPFMSTDAIFKNDDEEDAGFAFHYVIAHCFGRIKVEGDQPDCIPPLRPSDDALDAKWWTLDEILHLAECNNLSTGVVKVLKRAEELSRLGAFSES